MNEDLIISSSSIDEAAATTTTPASPQHVTPVNSVMDTSFDDSSAAPDTPARGGGPTTTTTTTPVATTTTSSSRDASCCVQVAVRVRPVLSYEKKENVCQVDKHTNSVQIGGKSGPRFTFDRVFDPSTTQAQLFEQAVQPLIHKCLQGYNATIFAYGQTGSGKTHTILGPADSWMSYEIMADDENNINATAAAEQSTAGVLPRALHALFAALESQVNPDDPAAFSYNVTLQFLEVYGEDLRDLLAPSSATAASKLTVREYNDEPEVPGAVAEPCANATAATRAVERGSLRRVTAATAMNATSSRSHALLTVALEQRWEDTCENNSGGTPLTKRSKFHFCDLAGSERQKRTLASGQRLKEGIDINKGLLVLGNVISALASNSSHVPYRDAKLTRLLRGSLGGNHQTLMMACVSPAPENMDESLNCLRYANRAKNIQNAAVVNLDATSRRLLALQGQIGQLARGLLGFVPPSKETPVTLEMYQNGLSQLPYSRPDLESLAAAGNASNMQQLPFSPAAPTPLAPHRSSNVDYSYYNNSTTGLLQSPEGTPHNNNQNHRRFSHNPNDDHFKESEARIASLEKELNQTRVLLSESQAYHDEAEMELNRYRAMEKLQQRQQQHQRQGGQPDGDKENSGGVDEDTFLAQATAYEHEIAFLRKELQAAERRAARLAFWQNVNPAEEERRLQNAEKSLLHDQARLSQLRLGLSLDETTLSNVDAAVTPASSQNDILDEEEQAEQADLQKWTKKFLVQSGHVEDDDEEDQNVAVHDETIPSDVQGKHMHLENDLFELTKSIEERENLIRELKHSQEKYASMRDYYEGKLAQMEAELERKQAEREQLVQQLHTAKTRGSTKDLQERLAEKDQNIASLREKQKELRRLTSVSQRNELDIARLQNDVVDMKRKRVDLQKQLTSERKRHADEVKQFKKSATQKDREMNKLQKISNQRELQAQKASQVAKARLEELSTLRAKNKEAEKKLRKFSVKKGVMEKAGIDSVLVGQRSQRDKMASRRTPERSSEVDADALRYLFDQKISEVVRKEALADKLAEEWEEHYELTNQKQGLLGSSDADAETDLQALSVKIKYKQDRIRQLAQKLGKQEQKGIHKTDGGKKDYELFDEQFRKLCKDSNPEQAQKTLAKVLFGMVVRERRRISSLARTASSLDEKLQQAEKAAAGSEAYLRSYVDEHKHLAAELSHSQQKNLLSLMEMVKNDVAKVGKGAKEKLNQNDDRKLLVLANERIAVLETHIQNLETEADQKAEYQEEIKKLREACRVSSNTREELDAELRQTFDALQEVRVHLENVGTDHGQNSMQSALKITKKLLSRIRKARGCQGQSSLSDQTHVSLTLDHLDDETGHSVSDDEAADEPDWAAEIMEDLAFIAEGKIPPSLLNLPGFAEQVADMESDSAFQRQGAGAEGASVFDRLTNPDNFTGTQKRKAKKIRKAQGTSATQRLRQEKAAAPSTTEHTLKASIPETEVATDSSVTPTNAASVADNGEEPFTTKKEYKSVFERLVSPSQATGTQRQKLARQNQPEEQSNHLSEKDELDDDAFDKMLDDALGDSSELQDAQANGKHKTVFDRLISPSQATGTQKHRITDKTEGHGASARLLSDNITESPSTKDKRMHARNYSDYAEQDVFERLQRTSTVASTLRQGDAVRSANSNLSDSFNEQSSIMTKSSTNSQDEATTHHHQQQQQPDYTSLNVFERLTRTTTEAYAKKMNRPKTSEDDHS